MVTATKQANLALAFVLELGVLVALGYWGFQTGQETMAHIGLGVGAPLIAVGVWALFGAPRSARRLRGPWLLMLRVIFFGSGAVALLAADQHSLGVLFVVVAAVNLMLIYVWEQ
jgi:hypothetical protein